MIGGRQVSLMRVDADEDEYEVVVCEDGMADVLTPLETFLEQSAHVAAFLESKELHKKDMTFGDLRIPDDTDPFTARLLCMQLACDQAEMREAHERQSFDSKAKLSQMTQEWDSTGYGTQHVKSLEAKQTSRSWWERITGRIESESDEEQ